MGKEGLKELRLLLPDYLVKRIEEEAKAQGFESVNDYLLHIIRLKVSLSDLVSRVERIEKGDLTPELKDSITSLISSVGAREVSVEDLVNKVLLRVERRVFDLINPYTSKIDELGRRIADLVERIEGLESKCASIEQQLTQLQKVGVEVKGIKERPRKSAIEILKEQKVIFESDLIKKIRNRDMFFNRLERDGAVIIQASGERIAVDPDFWSMFVRKVEDIKLRSEAEVKKRLSKVEYRLFSKLKESALIYYNAVKGSWELIT